MQGDVFGRIARLEALVALALARGAAAGTAEETVVAVPFTFASGSPLILVPVMLGHVVDRVSVVIETTFDGAGASLQVGTAATPGLILATSDIDPTKLGTYTNHALFPFAAAANLELTITPGGGATQGAGLVLVKVK